MGISVSEKDVHTNSESGKLNDQLLDTLKNLDIWQMTTDTIFVAELDIPAVQPIKFEEYQGQSYKHAKGIREEEDVLWQSNSSEKSSRCKNCGC
ncbi:hypothetical protein PS2_027822 [Malus domestica]